MRVRNILIRMLLYCMEPAPIQYNKRAFAKLNQYDYSDANMLRIRHYVLHGLEPEDLNPRQLAAFKKQFNPQFCEFNEDDQLVFTPLNLIVVSGAQRIRNCLNTLYNSSLTGLSRGINAFYAAAQAKYIGISREDVQQFLQSKGEYQLAMKPKTPQQKALTADFPNQKWGVDLLDMSSYSTKNSNYKYIVTLADYFSRRCALVGIKDKTLETVKLALEHIIHTFMGDVTPNCLICDNGAEFSLRGWCTERDIKLQHTLSHTPQQNGLVEQLNQTVRRCINQWFIRSNAERWTNALNMIMRNYNTKKHTFTGFTPDEIWRANKNPVLEVDLDDNIVQTQEQKMYRVLLALKERAQKVFDKNQHDLLEEGDYVRISTKALYSEIRMKHKQGESKLIPIHWSVDIFRISRVIHAHGFNPQRYECQDSDGANVLEEYKVSAPNRERNVRVFLRYDLMKVDENANDDLPDNLTEERAKKLNHIKSVVVQPAAAENIAAAPAVNNNDIAPAPVVVPPAPPAAPIAPRAQRIRRLREILDL
jgi:transposase InsO family protein